MAPPRKPTTILHLNGALRKNAKRYADRADEPIDNEPLGDPPSHLQPTEAAVWHEIKGQMVEGVALASDRLAFEMLCRLVGAVRTSGVDALDGAGRAQMTKLLASFGLTPADRSRVKAPPSAKKGNPFARRAG